MRLVLIFAAFNLVSNIANSQIFKFSHYLSQDAIQHSNFTLNTASPRKIHPAISFLTSRNFQLTKGLYDTIVTTIPAQIVSTQTFRVRNSKGFSDTAKILPGLEYSLVPGTEIIVPPNTPVNIPPGETYVTTRYPSVIIQISAPSGAFPDGNGVKALATSVVRLTATTRGIINVTSGKITFDPWQITNFVSASTGINDVDESTALPLELRDDRRFIGEPTKVLVVPYKHYTLSLNSIPFRYRGRRILADTVHSDATVTTAFNLALSFGHTWGRSHITTRARNDLSFTLGAFIGPSSAELKKENVKNPSVFVAGRTNPVLSYGINAIFARNGFGVLLAIGFDNAFGKYGNDWIYDNRPWLGFGISASFPK